MPEQHVQPVVDSGLVDDRHVGDQPQRASDGALEQAAPQLGIATQLTREAAVEQRKTDRLNDQPAGLERQRLRVLELPGTKDVALAQKLNRIASVDRDAADQQPL